LARLHLPKAFFEIAEPDRRVYLNPDTGRFNRLDPWSGNNFDPQSLHKYAYAHCDPINGIDPTGRFSIIEILSVASIRAHLRSLNIGRISLQARNASFRLLKATLQPFFRAVGKLPQIGRFARPGQRLTPLDRLVRFFMAQTRTHPGVRQGWFGRILLKRFPEFRWQQHHWGIQKSWFRPRGKNQWYPNDAAANRGMQRLGDAGFNLIAIPRGLNVALGNSPVGTAAFGLLTAGTVAVGTAIIVDRVMRIEQELNE